MAESEIAENEARTYRLNAILARCDGFGEFERAWVERDSANRCYVVRFSTPDVRDKMFVYACAIPDDTSDDAAAVAMRMAIRQARDTLRRCYAPKPLDAVVTPDGSIDFRCRAVSDRAIAGRPLPLIAGERIPADSLVCVKADGKLYRYRDEE